MHIMDTYEIAYEIVEAIKALPSEAKQTGPDSDLKTVWDEYKEQIQYEEYDSFSLYEDMIETMVRDRVAEEDDLNIETLHYFFNRERYEKSTPDEKREYIVESVLYHIKDLAETEEIEYTKHIDYIKYAEYEILIVAVVIKRIGPTDYLVHAYSAATGSGGEQGVVNMTTLEEECELEVIDFHKYHFLRQCFWPTPSGKTRKDLPKRKRVHSLRKHREEIKRRFRELD